MRLPSLACLAIACLLAAAPVCCETLEGTVTEVTRGDTLTMLDKDKARHRVRLSAIDAPDLRQAFGPESRRGLSDLLLGKRIRVLRVKDDDFGRIVGKVLLPPPGCATCPPVRDAGLAQLEAGLAWWHRDERRSQSLEDQGYYEYAEFDARTRRIGLWRDVAPEPPWEWRRREAKGRIALAPTAAP